VCRRAAQSQDGSPSSLLTGDYAPALLSKNSSNYRQFLKIPCRRDRRSQGSGSFLPSSPPAKKSTARQDQPRQASTGDGGGDGIGTAGWKERDVGGGIGAADDVVGGDGEPRGHRIEAIAGVGPNSLVKGRVGGSEQMARQRNGGSEDAVCRIEEGIHLHCPTVGEQVLPER
jgi:hypothetical protein